MVDSKIRLKRCIIDDNLTKLEVESGMDVTDLKVAKKTAEKLVI